jgi:hypothetical protein
VDARDQVVSERDFRGIANAGSLAQIAAALRRGALKLSAYLNDISDRVEAVDATFRALVPEADRRSRLAEAAALRRFPIPRTPPLFGVPVGVKDVFTSTASTRAVQLPDVLVRSCRCRCLAPAGALVSKQSRPNLLT